MSGKVFLTGGFPLTEGGTGAFPSEATEKAERRNSAWCYFLKQLSEPFRVPRLDQVAEFVGHDPLDENRVLGGE
jgi:hypothetical protein